MTDILSNLERAIRSETYRQPEPLCGDKWLVSSALQKSIRRGETETALRAATALWLQDRQNFWRRLHVTACEDVGVGDVEAVTKVLVATASSVWRRQIGDLRVGLLGKKSLISLPLPETRFWQNMRMIIWIRTGVEPRHPDLASGRKWPLEANPITPEGVMPPGGIAVALPHHHESLPVSSTLPKLADAMILKPAFMGIGIDLPKAWKWMQNKWRGSI